MTGPNHFPLLLTNISDALLECLGTGDLFLDGVEVGHWLTPEQIADYRRQFPGLLFYLHISNMISEVGVNPGAEERIAAYLEASGSPWLSLHLCVWDLQALEYLRAGRRPPLPEPEVAFEGLLRRLERLAPMTPVPILVENIEPLPYAGYDFWARPEYIVRVLEQSGCNLLLDIAHTRISAERLGMKVEAYLDELPLELTKEIHVNGPRHKRGQLYDAHASLQAVDYRLLELLLGRTTPDVITLEYIRQGQKLRGQLAHLKRLSASVGKRRS